MANLFCPRIISRLIKYVCLIGIVSHCTTVMAFTNLVTGGVLATPTSFVVTIFTVEYGNIDGSFFMHVDGTYTFDLGTGGTAAGEQAGICPGTPPPPGTYTSMRVTISDTFSMTGSVTDADTVTGGLQPGRTNTGNASTGAIAAAGLTGIGVAATDGAAATTQSVPIPTGAAVTAVLDASGISRSGGILTVSFPVSFTVTEDGDSTMPSFQMDFDITDTLNFFPIDGGGIGAIPLPPELNNSIIP